jgi:hypothetical protein
MVRERVQLYLYPPLDLQGLFYGDFVLYLSNASHEY